MSEFELDINQIRNLLSSLNDITNAESNREIEEDVREIEEEPSLRRKLELLLSNYLVQITNLEAVLQENRDDTRFVVRTIDAVVNQILSRYGIFTEGVEISATRRGNNAISVMFNAIRPDLTITEIVIISIDFNIVIRRIDNEPSRFIVTTRRRALREFIRILENFIQEQIDALES